MVKAEPPLGTLALRTDSLAGEIESGIFERYCELIPYYMD